MIHLHQNGISYKVLLMLYGVIETCSGCWIRSSLLLEHAISFSLQPRTEGGSQIHVCSYSETGITSGRSRARKNLKQIALGKAVSIFLTPTVRQRIVVPVLSMQSAGCVGLRQNMPCGSDSLIIQTDDSSRAPYQFVCLDFLQWGLGWVRRAVRGAYWCLPDSQDTDGPQSARDSQCCTRGVVRECHEHL